MYFFKDKLLAIKFKNKEVTQKQQLYYWLFVAATIIISQHMGLEQGIRSYFCDFMYILILIILYLTNSKGDNEDFLQRYICLSLPVTIRAILFGVIFALAFAIVFHFSLHVLKLKCMDESFVIKLAYTIFAELYVLYRLRLMMKIASKQIII